MRIARISTSLKKASHNLIYLSVSLTSHSSTAQALTDSGATLNFIHESLVSTSGLVTEPCPLIEVLLADGRVLTHANRQISLKFTIAGVPQTQNFIVAPLGIHSIILGMPWLETVNPDIDWRLKSVKTRTGTPLSPPEPVSLPQPSEPASSPQSKPKSKSPQWKKERRGRPPESKPIPVRPKVLLTRKIDSNDQVYLLHLDSITPLPEYLSALATSQEQQPEIPEEYRDLAEVFSKTKAHELPPHRGHLDHHIPLEEGAKPVFGPIYNLSETELQVLKDYIDENLRKRFIRPSTSPFGSPVLFVKKADGSLRLCVDYRALNRITIKNRYPIPLISELIDRFKSKKYFTRLDVRDAFNRLRIAKGDEHKTAFRTRYGHFEYLVMPFGLTGAPGSFQSYINEILRPHLDIFCVVYLDDILIYSDTLEEHIRQVRLVLKALQEHGLYVKLEKCEFHVQSINFLGFVITPNGVHMDRDRITTITEWPAPRSVTEIQIFLGFANFYRRFIEGYSRVVIPITTLLRKGHSFEWNSHTQKAFDNLKSLFASEPILCHFDPELLITLHTDASSSVMSGIISQPHVDRSHPITYWSRKWTPAECNYDIHDREMLAIVESMKHWRHYLEGAKHPINVRSDHKNLETFMTTKILNRRQAHWAEILSGYDFVLEHIPGSRNPADGLSRRPDYAVDVDIPSGSLIPRHALHFLPPHLLPSDSTPVAPKPAELHSVSVFQVNSSLHPRIIQALSMDPIAAVHRQDPNPNLSQSNDQSSQSRQSLWSWEDGLLLYNNLIYVPQDNNLRLELL